MKKTVGNLFAVLTAFCIVLSAFMLTASADSNTTISFSKSNVQVGDTVTVTVNVKGTELTGADFSVSYDENVLTYKSGATSGGAGVLKIVDIDFASAGIKNKSYTFVFTAAKSGSCTVSASGSLSDGVPASDVAMGAAATMVVKDVAKSANANLKSLNLSSGGLSPKFSPDVTNYTVNVAGSVENCEIYAVTSDKDAKVSVSGSSKLAVGDNKRTVTVTAPSGAQKVYTVTVKRAENTDSSNTSDSSDASSDASSGEETEQDPMSPVIDGVEYKVCADISSVSLPTGFSVQKTDFKGNEVGVAVDKNNTYKIFYLTQNGTDNTAPYVYDEETESFYMLLLFKQNDNVYIIADFPEKNFSNPDYYADSVDIGEYNVKCYLLTEGDSNMAYLYCFFNGEYGYYRYDKLEKTIQRSTEFSPFAVVAPAEDGQSDSDGNGIASRFKSLSSNARTVLVCLALFVIGIIVLVILVIVRVVRMRRFALMAADGNEKFESIDEDEDFPDFFTSDEGPNDYGFDDRR